VIATSKMNQQPVKSYIMKTRVITFSFLSAMLILVFTGCRKDLEDVKPMEQEQKVETMGQLKVSDNFDWNTTRDIDLVLTSPKQATVVIQSASGDVYEKALLIPGETYTSVLSVPSYEKELTMLFDGKKTVVQVSGNKLVQTL
jgi:hypothetical protein